MEIRRFKKSDTVGVANVIKVPMDVLEAKVESLFSSPIPVDAEFKHQLKELVKASSAGIEEILDGVRNGVSCVACDDNGKVIGYGTLRDVKMGCSCMVLPEYKGKGVEEELDEACWQYALKERPSANTLPIDALKFHDNVWDNALSRILEGHQKEEG